MRRPLLIAALAAVGVLAAASIGYAAYVVSHDSVGLPVTKLDPAKTEIAPARKRVVTRPRRVTTTRAVTTVEDHPAPPPVRTVDDHSGRSPGGSGHGGSGSSGHGGGGDD